MPSTWPFALEDIRSQWVSPPAASEEDHFISCPDCGARLDMRRLDEILAHEEAHSATRQ